MREEVQHGDIFLTSEAPLGEHMFWRSDEKLVLSQRIFGIRTKKEELDPFYFNYFITVLYLADLALKQFGIFCIKMKKDFFYFINLFFLFFHLHVMRAL